MKRINKSDTLLVSLIRKKLEKTQINNIEGERWNNNKPFLDRIVMFDAKRILYDNWQYKAELAPETDRGPCLLRWSDPQQLSESQGNLYI